MSEVTLILERAQQGDPKAAEELLPLVYEELRKLAAHKMAHEAAGHTLQPTALVHEINHYSNLNRRKQSKRRAGPSVLVLNVSVGRAEGAGQTARRAEDH